MPNQPTAQAQAGDLPPWEAAITHVRIPALLQFLFALLAALSKAAAPRRALRLPRQDWFLSANISQDDDQDENRSWRHLRRARAEIGWLLRGHPNRGMSILGHRAPVLRPPQTARAPPSWPRTSKSTPNPFQKPRNPRRRVMPEAPPGPSLPNSDDPTAHTA